MPDALSTHSPRRPSAQPRSLAALRLVLLQVLRLVPLALLGPGLALTACRQDVTEITGAKRPGDTTSTGGGGNAGGGGGTVQRATLTVTVGVAPEDTALTRTLGLAGGVLPGAEVTIQRQGTASSRQTAAADATGRAEFTQLLPGDYTITVQRPLAPAEVARLGSENADVTAFGGGGTWGVGAPATAARVEAVLGRRGSLVISEVYAYGPPTASVGAHRWGNYFELYNNADTVIYLDRVVIGKLLPQQYHDAPVLSCAINAMYRMDTAGVWTRDLWQFPGSGRDYPLAPGKAVVLATDAMDHRVFNPGLLDLSTVEFEFLGTAEDVNNPFVPDIRLLGGSAGVFGHGLETVFAPEVIFVAAPIGVPLTSLPQDRLQLTDLPFWRYPRDRLLDVSGTRNAPGVFDNPPFPECIPLIHPVYDQQPAPLGDYRNPGAVRRRVFATLPDGRVILQRTRTSARDFERVPTPTPGRVP